MSQPQYSEEELRAIEAEMDRISVDDVLLQTLVSLLNLGARKAGLAAPPGEGPPPDLEQLRQAIEGAAALLPVLEPRHADKLGPVRDTLAQLQMFYAQAVGAPGVAPVAPAPGGTTPGGPAPGAPAPGGGAPGGAGGAGGGQAGAGSAQRSGRLWIPGQ